MDLPSSLDGWDLELLQRLADENAQESDRHDYKAILHGPSQFSKTVCAFANTRGGFILLGMSEEGDEVQLTGLPPKRDPGKEIGKAVHDKLKATPSLSLPQPKRIELEKNDRAVCVVQVPESNRKPHLREPRQERTFWKRVQGTCQRMSREEVRMQLEETERRRRKVRLALKEVDDYLQEVKSYTRSGGSGFYQKPPATAVDTLWQELPALVNQSGRVLGPVSEIRRQVRRIEAHVEEFIARGGSFEESTRTEKYLRQVRGAGRSMASDFQRLTGDLEDSEGLVPEELERPSF